MASYWWYWEVGKKATWMFWMSWIADNLIRIKWAANCQDAERNCSKLGLKSPWEKCGGTGCREKLKGRGIKSNWRVNNQLKSFTSKASLSVLQVDMGVKSGDSRVEINEYELFRQNCWSVRYFRARITDWTWPEIQLWASYKDKSWDPFAEWTPSNLAFGTATADVSGHSSNQNGHGRPLPRI